MVASISIWANFAPCSLERKTNSWEIMFSAKVTESYGSPSRDKTNFLIVPDGSEHLMVALAPH